MREKLKDKTKLIHILQAIDNLFEFTGEVNFEEYRTNKILRFAVIKNLEIIGEAAYLLTKEYKTTHPVVEWDVMNANLVVGIFRWALWRYFLLLI